MMFISIETRLLNLPGTDDFNLPECVKVSIYMAWRFQFPKVNFNLPDSLASIYLWISIYLVTVKISNYLQWISVYLRGNFNLPGNSEDFNLPAVNFNLPAWKFQFTCVEISIYLQWVSIYLAVNWNLVVQVNWKSLCVNR